MDGTSAAAGGSGAQATGTRTASVSVVVRVRPPAVAGNATDKFGVDERENTVTVLQPRDPTAVVHNAQESTVFSVNGVFGSQVSQADVYARAAADIVDALLQGYNGTIMAYGQTGAGKTHTIMGPRGNFAERGLIPRCISAVFEAVEAQHHREIVIRVSCIEIYNDKVYDLLNYNEEAPVELGVYEDKHGGTYIKDLATRTASSVDDAMGLLFQGETNRAIAEHQMNKASTRSHVIFTIYVQGKAPDSEDKTIQSKLHLVDLAGSERVAKTGSTGETFKEATHINKSLTFLEQVVMALVDKSRDHVPYRQTKLTNVLKDSLGGNCRTRLIANVWPEDAHLDETLATLKFATRMMRVKTRPLVNTSGGAAGASSGKIAAYEAEIKQLRKELALHDMIAGHTNVKHAPYNEEQVQTIRKSLQRFLSGMDAEMPIVSLRQAQVAFRMCRELLFDSTQGRHVGFTVSPQPLEFGENADVLFVEQRSSAGASAPKSRIQYSAGPAAEAPGSATPLATPTTASAAVGGASDAPPVQSTDEDTGLKAELFESWKAREGAALESKLTDIKATIRDKKNSMKQLTVAVNDAKREIDALSATSGDTPDVAQALKEAKKKYRAAYESFTERKAEVTFLTNELETSKAVMLREFNTWYAARGR